MLFHVLVVVLALALASAAFPILPDSYLPAHGNTSEIEWAAANMSLFGDSSALGLNARTVQSLSDVWDLPTGLLFCNESSDITINHNYMTSLINGVYAGKAESALLGLIAERCGRLPTR